MKRFAVSVVMGTVAMWGMGGCQSLGPRTTTDVDGFYTVNLRPYTTAGFATDKETPVEWNDLREFPTGRQVFLGIPFDIIDEDKNKGTAQIELGSSEHLGDELPLKVMGVDLGERRAERLYIIQKSAWSKPGEVGEYRIHYAQPGLTETIPLVIPQNLRDWHGPGELPEARVAWQGKVGMGADVGVYMFTWENPHPEVPLDSLDFISNDTGPVLSLIAITGEKPKQ
ncbi:MAG: hypothetical protein GXY33_06665 [Phycisphaerae bacterium]|nr:hypothetical protein [Phycisphaerae bacterium]